MVSGNPRCQLSCHSPFLGHMLHICMDFSGLVVSGRTASGMIFTNNLLLLPEVRRARKFLHDPPLWGVQKELGDSSGRGKKTKTEGIKKTS